MLFHWTHDVTDVFMSVQFTPLQIPSRSFLAGVVNGEHMFELSLRGKLSIP